MPTSHRPHFRPINRQPIRLHIPGMIRMSLDPLKTSPHAHPLPLLNLPHHILNDILILDRLACRRFPSVPPPVLKPGSYAVDGVFAVGYDDDVAVSRDDFEGA